MESPISSASRWSGSTANFEIIPAAAESWEGSEDGMTWTFKIREGLTWSDGNPVTAADWVTTFQYAADPEHAWDFTWFFQGVIKNWNEAVAGEVTAPDQIGVAQGANEYELVFETEAPAPYLPAMLLYSLPLSAAALASTAAALYNTDPATAVSSGPFMLSEWTPEQQIVYTKNPKYTGSLQVHGREGRQQAGHAGHLLHDVPEQRDRLHARPGSGRADDHAGRRGDGARRSTPASATSRPSTSSSM